MEIGMPKHFCAFAVCVISFSVTVVDFSYAANASVKLTLNRNIREAITTDESTDAYLRELSKTNEEYDNNLDSLSDELVGGRFGDQSDSITSNSLVGKRYDGAHFDSLASGLIGKRYDSRFFDPDGHMEKKYDGTRLDSLASGLIGKRNSGGQFDSLASGLVGKRYDGAHFDSLASGLVGKRSRYFDPLASGLVGKRRWYGKRHRFFDSLASGLVGKRNLDLDSKYSEMDDNSSEGNVFPLNKRRYYRNFGYAYKRPFDSLASSLIG